MCVQGASSSFPSSLEVPSLEARGTYQPTRLRILELLLDGPRTVRELIDQLGCSRSRVSNHLACLRWCGFAEADKSGRTAIYSIRDRRVADIVAAARDMASDHCEHLASCTRIGPD